MYKKDVHIYRSKNVEKIRKYDSDRHYLNGKRSSDDYLKSEGCKRSKRIGQIKWQKKYPYKKKAADMVRNALKNGDLKRLPCEICGKEKSQGHHDDYNYPLSVVWLCRFHHIQIHKLLKFNEELRKYEPKE